MNGKGRGPMKGYNWQKYAENYDQIFRTMKTNQEESTMTTKQLAPVLPWHREAATAVKAKHGECGYVPNLDEVTAIIAAHDPHAETVRLLEESFTVVSNLGSTLAMMSSPDTRWESPMMTQYREHRDAIRTHLAKLKGTQ